MRIFKKIIVWIFALYGEDIDIEVVTIRFICPYLIVIMFFFLLFTGVQINSIVEIYKFDDEKEISKAEIIDYYYSTTGKSSSEKKIDYEYIVDDNIYIGNCVSYYKAAIGDTIEIVYNKSNPKISKSYFSFLEDKNDYEEGSYFILHRYIARYIYEKRKNAD